MTAIDARAATSTLERDARRVADRMRTTRLPDKAVRDVVSPTGRSQVTIVAIVTTVLRTATKRTPRALLQTAPVTFLKRQHHRAALEADARAAVVDLLTGQPHPVGPGADALPFWGADAAGTWQGAWGYPHGGEIVVPLPAAWWLPA